MLNVSSCPPGHNTPVPLERSPPASFKRLLGGTFPERRSVCDWQAQLQLLTMAPSPVSKQLRGGPACQWRDERLQV